MGVIETGLVALRDRKRLAEITAVIVRFGLTDIFERFGLSSLFAGQSGASDGQRSTPERLRLAIEALGPSFIKLGQILSSRSDLLGPAWIEELEKLQSAVPPEPYEAIAARVAEELGDEPEEIFAQFSRTPLAAGSIAQVHRARLKTGEEVIVKIRRSGLAPLIQADMRLLGHLASLAQERWPDLKRLRPQDILANLGKALRAELDLTNEASNCEEIAANLARNPHVTIPRIYREWSSDQILVQQFIDGLAPSGANLSSIDGKTIAQRGATAFLTMALLDGVFHADPHAGNMRVLPDNRIAFLDFGMVGRLTPRRREQLLTLMMAIVDRNPAPITRLLLEWSGEDSVDTARLESDCDAFIATHGVPPLRLADAIGDFMGIARQHALALPSDLVLLFKAMITADGLMRSLDRDFDVIGVAEPLVRKEMSQRLSAAEVLNTGRTLLIELTGLSKSLPTAAHVLLDKLKRGKITAAVEVKGLEKLGHDLRWAATRLGVAVVTAGFALGLAPHLIENGPRLLGMALPAWVGLVIIGAGLAWIVWPARKP